MNSLCDRLEFYAFKAGDIIVRQGEQGDHLFITEAPWTLFFPRSRFLELAIFLRGHHEPKKP